MHTNLFISLMVNGIVVIIYKSVIALNALGHWSDGIASTNSVSTFRNGIITRVRTRR